MRTTCVIVFITLCMLMAGPVCAANPYGVAGYGRLAALSMPSECIDYDWNRLHTEVPVQMVRPNNEGYPIVFHRYDRDTKQANDPAQFQAWVTANPGKIWIVGNEPDNADQSAGDDFTIAEYVEFYHYYYTTISSLDPTARFAIAGCLGGSTYDRYQYSINWIQQVMDLYRTNYGVPMPIDIWNVHSYAGPKQFVDPDKIIDEFVTPFVNWCHTVENGAYADNEVWITECPIGEWMGACSMENATWFLQHYMPRLERAGIDRWFWFVSSSWGDAPFGTVGLTAGGAPTPLGQVYSQMASSYPNPVPPVDYEAPAAPQWFSHGFSVANSNWKNKAGYWGLEDGTLRHTGIYPWWGTSYNLFYDYQDCGVSFRMKINSAEAANNWGAVGLCVENRFQTATDSGYLIYVRQNGEIGLHNAVDGTVTSAPDAVLNTSEYHDYRVIKTGFNFRVWVDNQLVLDWTDPNGRYPHGLVALNVGKADCTYDDVRVISYPTPLPQIDDGGMYTYNTDTLPVSWTMQDIGASLVGYRYAVGTAPEASDVVDWTDTTATSADIPGSFTPGVTYYVSVKAVYPGGLESSVGTSDGITPVIGAPNVRELKDLAPSTYALLQDVVVSGVFPDCVYVQQPDRSGGIRVDGAGLDVEVGDVVDVAGFVTTSGREAVLTSPKLFGSTPDQAPRPLGMNNRSTAGAGAGLQAASVDDAGSGETSVGASNTGLLVRTGGQVTYVDPAGSYAYVDDGSDISDGSGNTGIRLSLAGLLTPKVGAGAAVTGCLGAVDVAGQCARYLRPRGSEDVWFSMIGNYLANSGFESGSASPWSTAGSAGELKTGSWYFSVSAHSGNCYYGVLGNYTAKSGVLYQSVDVEDGTYQAEVWSRVLHGGNQPDAAMSRIGVDPTGGNDPTAASVLWSGWDTQDLWYQSEWRRISTPTAAVSGGRATVFLEYKQQDNTGWHINCFDDAGLSAL